MSADTASDVSVVNPDELLLRELLHLRAACLEKRRVAVAKRAIRARVHAIDTELDTLQESIHLHCTSFGLPLPEGTSPTSQARADGREVAERILQRYVSLLRMRTVTWVAASRAGDVATALKMDLAYQADAEAIRKHCECARLPLPSELLEEI